MTLLEELKSYGLIKQIVFEEELDKMLTNESVNFYCGYDPTADSLTIGHFMTLITCAKLQKAGHKPYIMIGGGTAMVGDPSNRTDMRKMLTKEQIDYNIECFKKQFQRILNFEGKNGAVIVNNADWLLKLNYIDFLRDVGANLSVNKMLSCECFKSRWERGLSFLEFNYMPMQAYDFYHLYKTYNVKLEIGGDDQWSNILAGADLIRRKCGKEVYTFTMPLLTKSDGTKMGKTASGAIWLDINKTSHNDLFQYFRNVADSDVYKCFCYLTLLPLEEIKNLTKEGADINYAKQVLAHTIVSLVHGKEYADDALKVAQSAFGGNKENLVAKELDFEQNKSLLNLLVSLNFAMSKSQARKLIEQNAVKINDKTVVDVNYIFENKNVDFIVQKGKKNIEKVKLI